MPFEPPLQLTPKPLKFDVTSVSASSVGSVIVADIATVLKFASVIVTVYVPALKPVAASVVCAGFVFHA